MFDLMILGLLSLFSLLSGISTCNYEAGGIKGGKILRYKNLVRPRKMSVSGDGNGYGVGNIKIYRICQVSIVLAAEE